MSEIAPNQVSMPRSRGGPFNMAGVMHPVEPGNGFNAAISARSLQHKKLVPAMTHIKSFQSRDLAAVPSTEQKKGSRALRVSAGIKQRHSRRFCSWEAVPLAGTRYALYMSF